MIVRVPWIKKLREFTVDYGKRRTDHLKKKRDHKRYDVFENRLPSLPIPGLFDSIQFGVHIGFDKMKT